MSRVIGTAIAGAFGLVVMLFCMAVFGVREAYFYQGVIGLFVVCTIWQMIANARDRGQR